jgi:hypothetical protein
MGKGRGDDDTELTIGCGLCCVIIIVASFLIGFSFRKLDANEVGINFSANSQTLDYTKLYDGGTYFVGLGHSFYKFPKTVQELKLVGSDAVAGRTKDGMVLTMNCRVLFRYNISVDGLAFLVLTLNEKYTPFFSNITRSHVRDVASQYTAFEFWTKRDNITTAMMQRMTTELQEWHATVENFLLLNFELPKEFGDAITETDVQKQAKEKVQFEQEVAVTETQTRILSASKQIDIIALEANATATAITLGVDAQLYQIQSLVAAELESYQRLVVELGLSPQELQTFVWLDTMAKNNNATSYWKINRPKPLHF